MSRRTSTILLSLCILTFTIAVSAVGLWKYAYYAYNGLDLAIYTNVLYNLSFSPSLGEGELEGVGRWYSSIQGHSYLGDHVEPILLLLVPLFRLWPDARLLIIVQAIVLGLSAVPVYLLLTGGKISKSEARNPKQSFPKHEIRNDANTNFDIRHSTLIRHSSFVIRHSRPIGLVGLYLLNPLLWNAALFEFHALAFAPVFLLSAAVAYQRRRFGWFLLWILFACAVREDIGLIVAMVGIVALMEKYQAPSTKSQTSTKHQILNNTPRGFVIWILEFIWCLVLRTWNFMRRARWVITPSLLGAGWFVVATTIGAHANPSGSYAFRAYYMWLLGGADGGVGTMVWNVLAHPVQVLRTVIGIPFFDGVFGLLLPFAFLPLLRPRWLLLALPPFAALALSRSGLSGVVVTLHYGLLFLPALVLSTTQTICACYSEHSDVIRSIRMFLLRYVPIPRFLSIALLLFLALSSSFLLGPFRGIADIVVRGASPDQHARRVAYDDLLARVPQDAVVCAHAHALTALAARTTACNLSYALLGTQQFESGDYAMPPNLAFMLLDPAELQEDAMVYPNIPGAAAHAANMEPRLRGAVAQHALRVVAERDGISLLQAGGDGPPPFDALLTHATATRRGYRMPGALRDLRVVRIE